MLFWILTLFSCTSSCVFALTYGTTFLGSLLLGILAYGVLEIFSILFAYGVSLWLGRNGQYTLREKSRYYISKVEDDIYYAYNYDYDQIIKFPKDSFDKVYYDPTAITAYVDIEIYNNGGWRRIWLIDTKPDEYRYILHEPKKDEV